MSKLYDINVVNNKGNDISLSQYKGNILLIVNTATKCGLAPQYEGLQNLYEEFQDQGFYVLDFPSNQFLQTPHSNDEIDEFCKINYQTTFPRFDKVKVNGQNASALYKYLKKEISGVIKWNFTKFLVNREGEVVKRYAPTTLPEDIRADIEELL